MGCGVRLLSDNRQGSDGLELLVARGRDCSAEDGSGKMVTVGDEFFGKELWAGDR